MSDGFLPYELMIRLGAFAGIFAVMALWELLAPRRHLEFGRGLRWPNNLGIVVVDTLILRLVFPTAAVGLALVAEARGWGLFNAFPVPGWLAVISSVILLDLAIYLQHVLFHAVPALWRLHRMHHADLAFDVSTGVRFHPIEILLSMLIKLTVVAGLGIPALGVLLFEVLLNATSMFNHGNVRMPERLDRVLRCRRDDHRHRAVPRSAGAAARPHAAAAVPRRRQALSARAAGRPNVSPRRLLPRIALALLIAGLVTAAALNRERLDLAVLDAWIGGLGGWAPVKLARARGTGGAR